MKYQVLKKQPRWEVGEIVDMNDLAANEALKYGVVEPYQGDEPAKHVWIMADPTKVKLFVNQDKNGKFSI